MRINLRMFSLLLLLSLPVVALAAIWEAGRPEVAYRGWSSP
ncbi:MULTISPECIES: hypothetical protein [Roseovarius]|tara:strand:- start:2524 stop:2646 length:123 start_codon:yes stop_codon:yes gene_type:complete